VAEKPKTTGGHVPKAPPKNTQPPMLDELLLLDEFAMAVLTGAVAGKNIEMITINHRSKLAEACYQIAFAMIEEREKSG